MLCAPCLTAVTDPTKVFPRAVNDVYKMRSGQQLVVNRQNGVTRNDVDPQGADFLDIIVGRTCRVVVTTRLSMLHAPLVHTLHPATWSDTHGNVGVPEGPPRDQESGTKRGATPVTTHLVNTCHHMSHGILGPSLACKCM